MSTLNTALSTALSGMNAAQTLLSVTANNIANSNTPGYTDESVDLTALPDGGVGVDGIYPSEGDINDDGDNGDLALQMSNLSNARNLYNANAAVVNITNQMYGSLLDMMDNEDDQDSDQDDIPL
ncbi:MAG: flagellar basal body protein [Tepidisphaeraceae bacterium]|jgi:flagellar hook-associated protein FlgK